MKYEQNNKKRTENCLRMTQPNANYIDLHTQPSTYIEKKVTARHEKWEKKEHRNNLNFISRSLTKMKAVIPQ